MSEKKSIGLQILDSKFPQRINWYTRESIQDEDLDYKLFLYFTVVKHYNIINKIRLIKFFRMSFNSTLRDAKEAVEQIIEDKFFDYVDFGEIFINKNSLKYLEEYEKTMIESSAHANAMLAKFMLLSGDRSHYHGYDDMILSMKALFKKI